VKHALLAHIGKVHGLVGFVLALRHWVLVAVSLDHRVARAHVYGRNIPDHHAKAKMGCGDKVYCLTARSPPSEFAPAGLFIP
jgi:hypothetical protein